MSGLDLSDPVSNSIKRILLAAHARTEVAIGYQRKAAEEHRVARQDDDPYLQLVSARHYRMARLACGFDESAEPLYA